MSEDIKNGLNNASIMANQRRETHRYYGSLLHLLEC